MTPRAIVILIVSAVLALPAYGANTCEGMWGRMPGAVARRAAKAYGRTELGLVTLPSSMENGVAVGAAPEKFKRELERIWTHAKATKVAAYCAESGSTEVVDELFNAAVLPLLDAVDAGAGAIENAACRKSTATLIGTLTNLEYRFGTTGSGRAARCPAGRALDLQTPALVASESMRAVRDLYLGAR
jgi:hypothetical protein